MSWREINRRISACKALKDINEQIICLKKLYDETKDGMVAYALGEAFEIKGELNEALKYYREAEAKFPKEEYKRRARAAAEKVTEKLGDETLIKLLTRPAPAETKEHILSLEKLDLKNYDPETTVIIVACSRTKIWDVTENAPAYVPARLAYRGESFLKFLEWMEKNSWEKKGFKWVILSAKYGFIEPWQPICNYDVSFNNEASGPISDESLYRQVMFHEILHGKRLRDFKTVICIGGKTYTEKIQKAFKDVKCHIISLTQG
jgi:tetratricopeptide (TPR) repeat protein